MEACETCKYYKRCLRNIYDEKIERRYLIFYSNVDCWEENKESKEKETK